MIAYCEEKQIPVQATAKKPYSMDRNLLHISFEAGILEDPWYDATHQVRRVKRMGQIKWDGDAVFVSEAVRGELVGLAETERGDWTVRFMHVELGRIDRQTRKFAAAWHGRRLG